MSVPGRKKMGVIRRLLFSLVPLAILLGLGELVARLTWDLPANSGLTGHNLPPDESRIWGLRRGEQTAFGASFTVNDFGLRDTVLSDALYRVMTLGDSSVFGHGLQDSDTLHEKLRAEFGGRGVAVDVIDGGIPGYSSQQSLQLLDDVGWSFEPDLLVIGNLWSDNVVAAFSDREWLATLRSPTFKLQWLLRSSRLWWWFRWQVDPPEQSELPITWVKDPDEVGRRRVSLTEYAENLDQMLIEAVAHDTGVIFLSPCNDVLASTDSPEGTQWWIYFQAMNEVAERRSVPIVHGCEVLHAAGLTVGAAFIDNMHPSGALNAAYADALATQLAKRRWPENRLVPDPGPDSWNTGLQDLWDPVTNTMLDDDAAP